MKKYNIHHTNRISCIAKAATTAFAMALVVCSCNDIVDYNDGYTPAGQIENQGAPVINGVYDVTDTELEHPLTKADKGLTVRIVGQNLNHVQSVTFNTIAVDLTNSYTYADGAVLTIPSKICMAHENKIAYTTDKGSTSFDFIVNIPDLQINGLLNEFEQAGNWVTITGDNLDTYEFGSASKVYLGDQELETSDVTTTTMKVRIPENTPDNSIVTLKWQDVNGENKTKDLPFRNTNALLFPNISDTRPTVSGGDWKINVADNAIHFMKGDAPLGQWSWNTVDMQANRQGLPDINNYDDYVVKFEIRNETENPFMDNTNLKIVVNWGSDYPVVLGDGKGLNTLGEWQTISIPLSQAADPGKVPAVNSWLPIRFILQPGSDNYVPNFYIANLRIEKK